MLSAMQDHINLLTPLFQLVIYIVLSHYTHAQMTTVWLHAIDDHIPNDNNTYNKICCIDVVQQNKEILASFVTWLCFKLLAGLVVSWTS